MNCEQNGAIGALPTRLTRIARVIPGELPAMDEDSVFDHLRELQRGDTSAVQQLWERYFDRLVQFARQRLRAAPRRVADEEDFALSALNSFCQRAKAGQFPQLSDRNELWPLLVTITARKVAAYSRKMMRQKRGGGKVRGDSILMGPNAEARPAFENLIASDPTPEFAIQVADQLQELLDSLQDPMLTQVALKRLEGYATSEIAEQLNLSERTVHRKVAIIRKMWEQS